MLTLKAQPPTPAWKFTFNGVKFTREGEEPFIYTDADKNADLDPSRKGFTNRILRYAAANNLPLTQQEIFEAVAKQISAAYRGKYFHREGAAVVARAPGKYATMHEAPIPEGLAEAARRVYGANVAAEDDRLFLHSLTAKEWLVVLEEWRKSEPDHKDPKKFGPKWWFALHALGRSMNGGGMTVRDFIQHWKGRVPCPDCRKHFGKFRLKIPSDWNGLAAWANEAHRWVTQRITA